MITIYNKIVDYGCSICGKPIRMQIFKGTGVCCEAHRKIRDKTNKEK